jgi:hypothetical protein
MAKSPSACWWKSRRLKPPLQPAVICQHNANIESDTVNEVPARQHHTQTYEPLQALRFWILPLKAHNDLGEKRRSGLRCCKRLFRQKAFRLLSDGQIATGRITIQFLCNGPVSVADSTTSLKRGQFLNDVHLPLRCVCLG